MGELGLCTLKDIFALSQTQLLGDITTDAHVPILLIRALHNKIFYQLFFSLRCYFLYLDVVQIDRFLPALLLPVIFYALWGKRWRIKILITVVLFPLLMISNPLGFSLGQRISLFTVYYIGLSLIGTLKFFLSRFR